MHACPGRSPPSTVVGIDVGGARKGFHAVALRDGAYAGQLATGDVQDHHLASAGRGGEGSPEAAAAHGPARPDRHRYLTAHQHQPDRCRALRPRSPSGCQRCCLPCLWRAGHRPERSDLDLLLTVPDDCLAAYSRFMETDALGCKLAHNRILSSMTADLLDHVGSLLP